METFSFGETGVDKVEVVVLVGAEAAGNAHQLFGFGRSARRATPQRRLRTRVGFGHRLAARRRRLFAGGAHGLGFVGHVDGFEQRFCYDRFWADTGAAPNTRYLCSGLSLVVVGDARNAFYRCRDRGVLAQFRHQHFLLFLIAHFQKATLLMVSDQLAEALMAMKRTPGGCEPSSRASAGPAPLTRCASAVSRSSRTT